MDATDLRRLAPPDRPGVYLMRDAHGKILYIGKASSLKKRLSSYVRPPEQLDPKTQALVPRVADLEFVVTDSEVEALVLENTLIKKHRPRYNILMRDDKSYPYLKLSVQDPYPVLTMTRRPFSDAARYFGPFASGSLREVARILSLQFRLCLCRKGVQARTRPCLYFQMKQCDGACIDAVTPGRYRPRVKRLLAFLEGGPDPVTPALEAEMRRAAAAQDFERAAAWRDVLATVRQIRREFTVTSTAREDRDVIGLARSGSAATAEVFTVRSGNLEGRRRFFLQHTQAAPDGEILSHILGQYYAQSVPVPPDILLRHQPEDADTIRAWLTERRGGPVVLRTPDDSRPAERLLDLAETNAWLYLKLNTGEEGSEPTEGERRMLEDLQHHLGLPGLPHRIEAYDISNISGTDAVGSRVVFIQGRPAKSEYRRYRIQGVQGPNDPAMLQETLFRRLRRLQQEGETPPDLLLIDGGVGQLSAVRAVQADLHLEAIPAAGLAKRQEEIYLPGRSEPLRLPRDSAALKLLIRLRDEAHRFAVTYHRQVRGKRMRLSDLDQVEGLGPAKRRSLLRSFGSVESLLQADEQALAEVPGIGPELARRVRRALGAR